MNWKKQLRNYFLEMTKLHYFIFLDMDTQKIIMAILFLQILNCQDAMG